MDSVFYPGTSEHSTLGVSVLTRRHLVRSGMQGRQRSTHRPRFTKDVVDDLVFVTGLGPSPWLPSLPLSCCPLANRAQEQAVGDGRREGRREIREGGRWELICPKVKELNLFNSHWFIYCAGVIFVTVPEQISAGLLGRCRKLQCFSSSVCTGACVRVPALCALGSLFTKRSLPPLVMDEYKHPLCN